MKVKKSVEVHVETTRTRATPPPSSERFREVMSQGAQALVAGVESAASFVPGGSAVTAAIRGGVSSTSRSGGTSSGANPMAPGSGGVESPNMLAQSQDQTMALIELQQQISMEQRQFSTVSNVMKARHDTAKSVIHNLK